MTTQVSRDPSLVQKMRTLQRELHALRKERKILLTCAGAAILYVDVDREEIREANAAAATLTKYPIQQLIGMCYDELVHTERPREYAPYGENGREHNRNLHPVMLKRGDGTILPACALSCVIRRDGIPLNVVSLHPVSDECTLSPWSLSTLCNHADVGTDPQDEFPNIIGTSKQIREVCKLIGKVAKTDSTVLIQGESGTGKEVFARTIHYHSNRAKGPFIRVNCAALSETLLESELFGHVKGAFTGAFKDRQGRFGQADGGTILLDEIGSMSLAGQTKLLRVLQEREFEPVGSSATRRVDVRVIATTNVDLKKAVDEEAFRQDLYYRISVISTYLSPLRERKEDIPLLAHAFLQKYSKRMQKSISGFYPEAIKALLDHAWPGNVRELENMIERAVVVEESALIRPSSLAIHAEEKSIPSRDREPTSEPISLRQQLDILEKQIVLNTLGKVNWVRKDAALKLGIDPRNFNYFLKKHNISEKDQGMQSWAG